ncbi:MAG: hypothetical protein LBP87_07120 [Planctomycetaceae bacterium]|jgi:hypothetical protein|nr:hypothetical protein [Planctomycetaceae bacterium]
MEHKLWHSAFFGAIQLEFNEYRNELEFVSEHHLISDPLKIDLVIIKKRRNIVIQKNIAGIFRRYNVIEYKSPSVSVTIEDYYKTRACCWLYASFKHIDIKDMSLTMVITRHPRELLKYLKNQFGITSIQRGIYILEHDTIPTQVIVSKELSEDENLWLTNLNQNLTIDRLDHVTNEIDEYKNDAAVRAYIDVVIGANFQTYKKLMETKDMKTLTQHLKEMGLIDKWLAEGQIKGRAEGRAEGLAEADEKWQSAQIEAARKLKHSGVNYETIVEALGLSLKEVKRLK